MSSCVRWKMNVEKGKRVEAEGPSVDSGKGPEERLRRPRGEGEVCGPCWDMRGECPHLDPRGRGTAGLRRLWGRGDTRASTLASNCTTGK